MPVETARDLATVTRLVQYRLALVAEALERSAVSTEHWQDLIAEMIRIPEHEFVPHPTWVLDRVGHAVAQMEA